MELIHITEQNGQRAVSARELHQFLESKQEFANWIKNRIRDYGFVEGQDFEVFDNFIKNSQGGRPTTEYAISIDMAKELSMVERNEKGKLARLYFIEMEKKAKEPQANAIGYQKPLILEYPTESYREQAKEKQRELMKVIRCYLKQGDITDVARTIGRSYETVKSVLNCHHKNPKIIEALYQRAMRNKESLLIDYETMIDNLKK